jgi:hypothetical protein
VKTSRPLLRLVTDDEVVDLEAHAPEGHALEDRDTIVIPVMSSDEFAAYYGTAPQLPAPDFAAPAAPAAPASGRARLGRAFALAVLVATVLGASWGAMEIHHVVSDTWIAPAHAAPDGDAVAQLRAEVARLGGQLAAISLSLDKLSSLRGAGCR